jgi:phosphoglycerate dehydrogenase-like enzyme
MERLATFARVRLPSESHIDSNDLPVLVDGAAACITGWGTPLLSEALLAEHDSLRLIAHTAGSIRNLVPLRLVESGLRVSHAAAIIADAVAEFVVSEALLGLRPLHDIDRGMKTGEDWMTLRERHLGRLLGACTVGIIGAGYVGRKVIHLFRAFGSNVLVYDPLLSDASAATLGVSTRTLDELLEESGVVSLHAPVLPETRGMIGAAQLARLCDGALFINTARAALVDEAALLRELQSGRISAALDVFATEPLPLDSPFRALPNVILSPHAAGHTSDTYLRQGAAMVDEVRRLLLGQPLLHEITAQMLPTMA